jgi:hypothetical protein
MKTIKIIHYPENGNRTTEIFEADKVAIVEHYLHDFLYGKSPTVLDEMRTFGSAMKEYPPEKYWVIALYLDDEPMLAGLNSKIYVMVDGKTVASYESIMIE